MGKKIKVVYSEVMIAYLAQAFGKSTQTVKRWILQNDDRLTSDRAKEALEKYNQTVRKMILESLTKSKLFKQPINDVK